MGETKTTAAELRQMAGLVATMTIAEAEKAVALATAATGYSLTMRGTSLIACVIRHLLDAADTVEIRAYSAAIKAEAGVEKVATSDATEAAS